MAVKQFDISPNGHKKPSDPAEPPGPKRRRGPDFVEILGYLGLLLGALAVGGVLWAINGGYSVLGLEVIARAFNAAGAAFWAWLSGWTFTLPSALPGLPLRQPVVPWVGVVAASLLQVSVLLLTLQRRAVPGVLAVAAAVFSVYDYGTTVYGLGTVPWLKDPGLPAQAPIAFVLTFSVEATAAFLIRHVVSILRR